MSEATGHFYLEWSLTNDGAACHLPGGRPTLDFADSGGTSLARYSIAALGAPGASTVALARYATAWFLTEESTTHCGTGVTEAGGPFHYVVGLPGGGSVTWSAPYLSGATLADFCATVDVGVGPLRSTRPSVPT